MTSIKIRIDILEKKMAEKKLSSSDFCEKVGFARRTFNRIKKEGVVKKEKTLNRISDVLNCSKHDLIDIPYIKFADSIDLMRREVDKDIKQINGWTVALGLNVLFLDESNYENSLNYNDENKENENSEYDYIFGVDTTQIHAALAKSWEEGISQDECLKDVKVPTLIKDGNNLSLYNATIDDEHVQILLEPQEGYEIGHYAYHEILVAINPSDTVNSHFLPRKIQLGKLAKEASSIQFSYDGIDDENKANMVGDLYHYLIELMNWENKSLKDIIINDFKVNELTAKIEENQLKIYCTPYNTSKFNDLLHKDIIESGKLHVVICPLSHSWVIDQNRCYPHTMQGHCLGGTIRKKSDLIDKKNEDEKVI